MNDSLLLFGEINLKLCLSHRKTKLTIIYSSEAPYCIAINFVLSQGIPYTYPSLPKIPVFYSNSLVKGFKMLWSLLYRSSMPFRDAFFNSKMFFSGIPIYNNVCLKFLWSSLTAGIFFIWGFLRASFLYSSFVSNSANLLWSLKKLLF